VELWKDLEGLELQRIISGQIKIGICSKQNEYIWQNTELGGMKQGFSGGDVDETRRVTCQIRSWRRPSVSTRNDSRTYRRTCRNEKR
jgi:hypothetical protein